MTIALTKTRIISLFVVVFIVFLANTGCLDLSKGCENEVVQEVISPNKTYRVLIFEHNCGATTGYSTHISILPISTQFSNDMGNVFICDGDHGKAPSGLGGGPPVLVEWKNENSLVITYDSRSRVFSSITYLQGITISYQQKLF
jgi:hypothetical protein